VELLGIFSADLDGEIVKYEWDFDGPISGEEWLDTEDEGYVEHTYSEEGAYLATMRVTDDLGATDTAAELIVVHEPTPPRAELEYIQFSTDTPSHVLFDASPSVDDDGLIVRYEWDFDDDGEFEYDGGAEPTADFYYWAPGTYDATVRVTDDDGLSDTARRAIVVTEDSMWRVTTIRQDEYLDTPPAEYAGLLEVSGSPAVIFSHITEEAQEELAYTRALTAQADEWGEAVMLGTALGGGSFMTVPGFEIIDGYPAVANRDYYCRALDQSGGSWPEAQAFTGNPRRTAQLLEIQGKPAIADRSAFHVSADATGSSWEEAFSFGHFHIDGDKLWLQPIGGKPAIVAARSSDDRLIYFGAENTGGTAWGIPTVVAEVGNGGGNASLIEAAGHPAIVYNSAVFSTIEYRRALNPQGTAWGEPVILHDFGHFFPSMTVFDGRPAVVYCDLTTDKLYFRAANDSLGRSWGLPVAVDPAAGEDEVVHAPLRLTAVNGKLAVAYRSSLEDGDPGKRLLLKYAEYR